MASSVTLKYRYSPLLPTNIRLLRILPSGKNPKPLRCELFEYPLHDSSKSSPYDALSYCWGGENKPKTIIVDNYSLQVTQNLYAALLHLRDHNCSRVMWIDAVCINQDDNEEKEGQIPLMAEIYARASHVVVWLGEAENDSHNALEVLRLTGNSPVKSLNKNTFRNAIQQLLQRPWFRRIWVLQEMAAAQHVRIMCGSSMIDGHAFCLGLDSLDIIFSEATTQVTFLIRGAIFRSGSILKKQGRVLLDICSLGELADMYHTHEATNPHDKIYALLNMCSEDLSAAGLEPDYNLPWRVLMQRVAIFLLSHHVSVDTWTEKQRVIIKSKGCVLGKVSAIDINYNSGSGQIIEITTNSSSGYAINEDARWILQTSAKSVRKGDLVCLLQGALKPTIIRLWGDHFIIIVIGPVRLKHVEDRDAEWSELAQSASFIRDFLLVWRWGAFFDNQDSSSYEALSRVNDLQSQHTQTESEIDMNDAIRRWNTALILGDAEELTKAEERRHKAADLFQVAVGEEHMHSLECQCSLVPLLWAAENGKSLVVDLLLHTANANMDVEDQYGRTPLSWAAGNGHEAVAKLLLKTGKVDVDTKDKNRQTPLSWAAENGHDAVVKLLLETGKIDVDTKDKNNGRTPLSWAAGNGHEVVAKLLLKTGKVDVDMTDKNNGRTPLSWAAANGHEAIAKLLLETGKVDVDMKDKNNGRTPLLWAAANGHEAVAKLLLKTGKVDVDMKDKNNGRTPLLWAAANGHEAVMKLLLETGKIDVDTKDKNNGRTPLSWAAGNGHEAVAKLLLKTGKVDVDTKDKNRQTPLSWAAENGHDAVVKLLLETSKIDVDTKDKNNGRTPLSWAAGNGHEVVAKLLLETGKVKVDVDTKDKNSRTPLSWAAANGHEAVAKLLLKTGKVDVDMKDKNNGRTPLSWAAANGHEAVAKLLLKTGKVDVDMKDKNNGRTPLLWAAANGHEAVMKLLLETGKVDVDMKDKNNRQTPLSWAAENGNDTVVKLLLETGKVEVDARDEYNSQTPLSWAAANGHEAVVKLLLETGKVDVDTRDKRNSRTPISWAARNGHEAVVKLLLETGKVNIDAPDNSGETPLSRAARNGHEAVVKLLKTFTSA